ncbi:SERTA domain-containing protein 3 [Marasmius crinis-equi]|uniref:SERTA domain-containing protein 3 n=1 Tax=Marasmius crinis-equi TaxID=585013 RepID=A0ABR3F2M7_9AGAR
MPAKPVFTGQRAEFLDSQKPGYAEAVKAGTGRDFVANVVRMFFNRWPPEMPLDVERPAEELKNVDDSVSQPDVRAPNPDGLSPAEYMRQLDTFNDRNTMIVLRRGQIERRLKRNKENANVEPNQKSQDPYKILLAKLNGTFLQTKPHKIAAASLWAKENPEIVEKSLAEKKDSLVAQRKEKEGKDKGKEQEKEKSVNKEIPKLWKEVVTQAYNLLSDEEKLELNSRAKEIFDAKTKTWEAQATAPPPTDPRSRQHAIDNLSKFVKPILDGIAAHTGWNVTMVAGGPEPRDSGRINVMSVHSGTTSGDVDLTWGQADTGLWRNTLFPAFASFCMKCYSKEECRARALINNPDEENEQQDGGNTREGEGTGKDDASGVVITFTADGYDNHSQGVTSSNANVASGSGARIAAAQASNKPSAAPSLSQQTLVPNTEKRPLAAAASASTDNSFLAFNDEDIPTRPPPSESIPPSLPNSPTMSPLPSPRAATPVTDRFKFSVGSSSGGSNLPPTSSHAPSRASSRASSCTSSPMADDDIYEGPPPPGYHHDNVSALTQQRTSQPQIVRRGGGKTATRSRKTSAAGDPDAKSSKKRPMNEAEEPAASRKKPRTQPKVSKKGKGAAALPSSALMDLSAPAGSPSYMVKIVELAKDVRGLEDWRELIETWFAFEEANEHGGGEKGRLSTAGRPEWVAGWIGRARSATYRPESDAVKVIDDLRKWWMGCQPDWREFDSDNLPIPSLYPRDGARKLKDWKVLLVAGPNGLSSVVACLGYAALRLPMLPRATGRAKLTFERYNGFLALLVQDLIFVLRRLSQD